MYIFHLFAFMPLGTRSPVKEAMFGRRKKDNGVSKEKNDEDELLKVRDLRAGRRCNEGDKK